MLQSGQREAEIFQLLNKADILNKRHIIRLLRTFEHRKHLCLVFELFNMDLRNAIRHYGKMALDHIASYGKQLFSSLVHMKKNNIIHADLKPDNILISKDTKIVKVCDFGTSFLIQDVVITDMLVSRFYRAPEIIMGYKYDYAIDVWSVACTLFEMYYGEGQFCFKGGDNNQLLKDQLQKRGKLKGYLIKNGAFSELYFDSSKHFLSHEVDPVTNKNIIKTYNFGDKPTVNFMPIPSNLQSEDVKKFALFKDLLEKALNMDPKKRLTADKAMEHPFFNQRVL